MRYRSVVHWVAVAWFGAIFAYAGLAKVLGDAGMREGMLAIGFGAGWTVAIGWIEVLGVAGLLAGVFKPPLKNLAVLCLLPFSIGAFTVHMSYHQGFADYRESLCACVLALVILATDARFKIDLGAPMVRVPAPRSTAR
ncbi:DoxX family protein [Pendulispora albinea]|uniref:DoxX family protein n=1 Tax=Pendulispora albinea TaxID=2741071 RepID=A0ABZ2LRC9_9BACT